MSRKLLSWYTSLDDSPIAHPSVFKHAQGNRNVQKHQAFMPLYYWDAICIWYKSWYRQERNSMENTIFEMDRFSFSYMSQVLSSCLCFLK